MFNICFKFTHLEEKKLSYTDHLIQAVSISYHLFLSGIAVFIHGIYPDIFVNTASNKIKYLYINYVEPNKNI